MLSSAAIAESDRHGVTAIMSAEDLKDELFGVRLEGDSSVSGAKWSECIQPDGQTVYRIEGAEMIGRLEISDKATACFSYAHDDYAQKNCFRVSRKGDGYTFWGGMEGVFNTTSVQRGITSCPRSSPKIS